MIHSTLQLGSAALATGQVAEFATLLASPREAWMEARTEPIWTDVLSAGPQVISALQVQNPPTGSFLRLLKVAPELRTAIGERLIYSELAIEWMGLLLYCDLLHPSVLPTLSRVREHLRGVVDEIRELYLDRGNLPTLFTEDLLNRVYERRAAMDPDGPIGPVRIPVIRLHVNLTTANKIDDSKGIVGNALLAATREWLRENFGGRNTYMDPVRTAFLVIPRDGLDASVIADRLSRFGPEVAEKMQRDPTLEGTVSEEKLAKFVPHHVALAMDFTVHDVPNVRSPGFDRHQQVATDSRMLAAIERFRQRMAASTVYMDEHHSPLEMPAPSLPLYTEAHLPSESDPVYETYLENLAGYMGDGVFGVTNGNPDGQTVKEHPRHRHAFGNLSRSSEANGGGKFEGFERYLATFQDFHDSGRVPPEDRDPLWDFYLRDGAYAPTGLRLLLQMGEAALRLPNYPRLFKPLQAWKNLDGQVENANVFAERVAEREYRQFVVFEYDSYKDFRRAYAPADDVDSEFQSIRRFWFDEAERMGLPEPLMTPVQGDLVMLACDAGDRLEEYVERVRETVRAAYADRPFPRTAKHTYERHEPVLGRSARHTVRLPIWFRDGRYRLDHNLRPGFQPYMGTLTVSGVYFELPRPVTRAEEGRALFQIAENAGKRIDDTVKYLTGETRLADGTRLALHKNGWSRLSVEDWPEALR